MYIDFDFDFAFFFVFCLFIDGQFCINSRNIMD